MSREKFVEIVRVIIAVPVMLVLLFCVWMGLCFLLHVAMAAMNVNPSMIGVADLVALVLVCLSAKSLYLRLDKVLNFLIR